MSTKTTQSEELLNLDRDELVEMLRQMIIGRRFEERTAEMYQMGEVGGFCHLYIGQEAVAAGSILALRADDYVITAYRDHVQALVRGVDPNAIMAELFGRVDGTSKGKGGSMHIFDAERNFLGGHAIVGSHLPLAVGVGYAIRYRESDAVCLCFMGDSVPNIGAFNESLNMAALWGLPVIFIVENNRFGMGTAWERVASLYDIAKKACAYDMPSLQVDGMDVLEMRRATQRAIERAREEKKPTLIEALCYRYMGHSMADPSHGLYRSKDEVKEQRQTEDPIQRFAEVLKKHDVIDDDDVERLDQEAQKIAADAVEFARESPHPEPDDLYSDIYAGPFHDLRRRDPWR